MDTLRHMMILASVSLLCELNVLRELHTLGDLSDITNVDWAIKTALKLAHYDCLIIFEQGKFYNKKKRQMALV